MSTVRFEAVSKVFDEGSSGEITAVSELELYVEDGEFLVLVGPSGCGKTTTLRMLAGLEEVTSGRIWIDEQEVTHRPPARRQVAMVFQNYALYPHKTAYGNIASGLRYSTDLNDERIRSRVHETAQLLGIEELLEKKPKDLSGGQQQRVALGRAIIREPRVFLFDEPLSNLDAQLRREMRAELITLQRRLGVTTVYVTHDQEEAMTMADRIAIMRGGRLQQVGEALEIYDHPINRFVAEFLGSPSMNFAPVQLEGRRDGGWELRGTSEEQLVLVYRGNRSLPSNPPQGTRLTLGIRPEDLRIQDRSAAGTSHSVEAEVRLVETLGSNNLVHVRLGERDWVVNTSDPSPLRPGETVGLGWDDRDVRLFGPEGDALLGSS